MDYVSGWYAKTAQYIQGTEIKCAFVSTNSITQGEQVGILWKTLLEKYSIKIYFAHRTFKWTNEASGKAGVYCVIIGFGLKDPERKIIFDYENAQGEPHQVSAKNINPYLVDGPNVYVESRQKPICVSPEIGIGNKPIDGGFYLFTPEEKKEFLVKEPKAGKYFRKWIGGEEFLNGIERWCLFLKNVRPEELKQMPEVLKRIAEVKNFRLSSKSGPTVKLAKTPTRFHVENISETNFLVVPKVNSDSRKYIPFGFLRAEELASDLLLMIPNANLYNFGVLQSQMHVVWVRGVCGRLGNGLRYSKDIVYNNYPWPENPSADKVKVIEQAAQNVLEVRKKYMEVEGGGGASLADLYDPLTMPPDLVKVHQELDRAVDTAYTRKNFAADAERLEFLFELYKKYTK